MGEPSKLLSCRETREACERLDKSVDSLGRLSKLVKLLGRLGRLRCSVWAWLWLWWSGRGRLVLEKSKSERWLDRRLGEGEQMIGETGLSIMLCVYFWEGPTWLLLFFCRCLVLDL